MQQITYARLGLIGTRQRVELYGAVHQSTCRASMDIDIFENSQIATIVAFDDGELKKR
jgi:hypothetical protein